MAIYEYADDNTDKPIDSAVYPYNHSSSQLGLAILFFAQYHPPQLLKEAHHEIRKRIHLDWSLSHYYGLGLVSP